MYNMVCLIGRLTADPELTVLENDKKVLSINLAVQRSFKNVHGVYEADFIKCVLWNGIADHTAEYCGKGDLVAIRGQIRNSSYVNDKEEKKYSTEIVVEKISFLATKNDNQDYSEGEKSK